MTDTTSDASVPLPKQQPGTGAQRIRTVSFEAPWDWLSAGWQDTWRNPALSLGYGAAFSVIAALLLLGLLQFGWQSLILVFGGGFLIVGPFLAVGLYEVSRRYDAGMEATFNDALAAGFKAPGQLLFMGAILLFMFFAWIRIAILLFMLFIGTTGFPPASEFMQVLLFTDQGLGLLVVGTAVGAVIAAFVYALSVISVPLLMVERRDAITAMGLSLEAVRKNFKPMALWAVLIAAFIVLGIATLFVGLVFAFPLVGHATWHAFKAIVVVPEDALKPGGASVTDQGSGI
jgi:uncharacterized membrane protein